jgi:Cof subfamily protein (haloacid dehalogenase superfamily)
MKPEDALIYSDMDGTMLAPPIEGVCSVPRKNINALISFIAAGGAVSIATGRKYSDTVGFFPNSLVFSAPLVLGNGSYIMEQSTQKILYRQHLDEEYKAAALEYVAKRDDVWLGANDEFVTMLVEDDTEKCDRLSDPYYSRMRRISKDGYKNMSVTKIVYVLKNAADTDGLLDDVRHIKGAGGSRPVKTDACHVEVVHASVSKAISIQKASALAGLEKRKLICFGDYYNDVEMLRAAEVAACPSGAPEDIRNICDIVTCGNGEGAFADLICKLFGQGAF